MFGLGSVKSCTIATSDVLHVANCIQSARISAIAKDGAEHIHLISHVYPKATE